MVTSINAYSVSLGLDAKSFIDTSRLSRGEVAALVRDINAARSPMESFAMEYDRLEKAYQSGAISLDVYQRLLDQARAKMAAKTPVVKSAAQAEAEYNKQLAEHNRLAAEFGRTGASSGLSKFSTDANSAGSALVTLGARFAGPIAAIAALKKSVSASFENQNALVSLEVLLGSVDQAKEKLAELKQIDATTPLTLDAALQATRTLSSFGIATENLIPTVRMLGDVTGADNERFKSMALAFAQVTAAGRLQGQDLRQMIDAGFNPLQEISRKTGESLVDLKARMEAGAISSREVADAFATATGEGGRFNGMMDRLGDTASGKFGQFLSQIKQMGVEVGDSLSPLIVQLVDLFGTIQPVLEPVIYLFDKMAKGLAFVVALANDVIGLFTNFLDFTYNEMSFEEYFGFKNASSVLDDMDNVAKSQNRITEAVQKTTAEQAKQQELAKRAAEGQKLREEQEKQNAQNKDSFDKSIKDMEDKISRSRRGNPMVDTAEIEAIRSMFDQTDVMGRNAAGLFEYYVSKGMDYNKHMDRLLTKDQQLQLEKFRSLAQQTQEIDEQEKKKKEGEEERKRLTDKAGEMIRRNDPIAGLTKEFAELQKMLDMGIINTRAFQREGNRLLTEAVGKEKIKIEPVSSIEAGSQEAYKFMIGQQADKQAEALAEAKKQSMYQQVQTELLRAIKDKPTVTKKR